MQRQNSTSALSVMAGGTHGVPPCGGATENRTRDCAIVQDVVAVAFGRSRGGPEGPLPQDRATAFARQIAMYLAHVGFGFSMNEVGRAIGRDRTTVVHACHVIEDRRDDPRFDELLDHLEQAAKALSAADRINRQR